MEKIKRDIEKERARIEHDEDNVVVNSDESFPASDPPSWTPVHGVGSGETKRKEADGGSLTPSRISSSEASPRFRRRACARLSVRARAF